MVHRFHTDDPVHQPMVERMDVLDQLQLGQGRPDDQDLLGALQCLRNRVVIRLILDLAAGFLSCRRLPPRRKRPPSRRFPPPAQCSCLAGWNWPWTTLRLWQ